MPFCVFVPTSRPPWFGPVEKALTKGDMKLVPKFTTPLCASMRLKRQGRSLIGIYDNTLRSNLERHFDHDLEDII